MENENIENDNSSNEAEVELETESTETESESTEAEGERKEKKPISDEAQLAIHKREMAKIEKRLGIKSEVKGEAKDKTTAKSSELDYGLEAYLAAKGIADEDTDYIKEQMKETGRTAKELLAKSWVQSELKERAEVRTSEKAVPKGTKRSNQSAGNSVEYHLAKYENGTMKLADMPFEMRSKVVEAAARKGDASKTFDFS
jgi:hypothetical protein